MNQAVPAGAVVESREQVRILLEEGGLRGRTVRDEIEAETDRIYFAPWPPLAATDVRWLRTILAAVIAGLPT